MTTALTWSDPDSINVARLAPGRRVVIGRGDQADVKIDDARISREHLAITAASVPGGDHQLEHLSHTNPTLLNGSIVQGHTTIADGAVIQVGDVSLTFHDLHARDTISGPVCHICGRENAATDRDCWFCGTSLLNAPTTLRDQRPVLLRVVSSSALSSDLYEGQWLTLHSDGTVESLRAEPPAGSVAVHGENGQPALLDRRVDAPQAAGSSTLATGANLTVDGARFAVIAREEPSAR